MHKATMMASFNIPSHLTIAGALSILRAYSISCFGIMISYVKLPSVYI